jgi:Ser/Thr protein kinase RdoA (MazF antagonist)
MAGEYTAEVLADLDLMVRNSLSRWDLESATTVRLINVSENATFALGGSHTGASNLGALHPQADLVLRVHRIGYSSAEEIRSELAWINALRGAGAIETLTPVRGIDGEWVQRLSSPSGRPARFAVAFERLPGREPDAGADAPRWFERLGEVTARMHGHARSWTLPRGFTRKRWNVEAMVGDGGYWGPWRAAIGLDGGGTAVIEQALALVVQRVERFGAGPDRFGLVHADLRLANLLVDGVHLRIIDFDDCGFSWFMYDFATAVSFIEHEPMVPDLLQAWVAGYRTVAPLSAEERAEIPTFVILRRILLTAWLASHSEVPLAQQFGAAYTQGSVRLAQEFLRGRYLQSVSHF